MIITDHEQILVCLKVMYIHSGQEAQEGWVNGPRMGHQDSWLE